MLQHAIALGLAAATVATIVRAFVPTLWLLIKPFSCDLCMSWWSTVLLLIVSFVTDQMEGQQHPEIVYLAATAVSMLTLKTLNRLSDIKLE